SDKGAGAALMMARTHSLVRGLAARPDAAALFREPEQAMALLNAALASGNDAGMFVTFLLGTVRFTPGRLRYVRAGHVPRYLRRRDASLERLRQHGGEPLDGSQSSAVELSLGVESKAAELVVLATQVGNAEDKTQRFERMERLSDQIGHLWSTLG